VRTGSRQTRSSSSSSSSIEQGRLSSSKRAGVWWQASTRSRCGARHGAHVPGLQAGYVEGKWLFNRCYTGSKQ
jgi:hypothetical protein